MTKKIDAVAVESHVKTLLDELKLKAEATEIWNLKRIGLKPWLLILRRV